MLYSNLNGSILFPYCFLYSTARWQAKNKHFSPLLTETVKTFVVHIRHVIKYEMSKPLIIITKNTVFPSVAYNTTELPFLIRICD